MKKFAATKKQNIQMEHRIKINFAYVNVKRGKQKLIVVLKDSLTGNIVGIISLIIGIISLIITVKTMRSARRIERDIKEAEVKAIDKDRFNKYKESCIKNQN